ncbi:MAG: TetR family transcriptional regulator [Pseudonocardiaceae bacterium]|nr:TetR family transcriptional regulator [Pseudonocardiaceae bacterium]
MSEDSGPPTSRRAGGTGQRSGTTRRRGRRPAGQDTRAALLDAARVEFTERGFDGATVRAIAERAGVDPAMVNHWFGGKDALFVAALQIPVNPDELVPQLLAGDPGQLGARIVRRFVTVWDATDGGPFVALLRSVSSHEGAARMLREFIARVVFGRVVSTLDTDNPELRAALCATQVAGLGMVRYVIRLEPLASADHDTVVTAIGPTLQRYLTGDLEPPSSGM